MTWCFLTLVEAFGGLCVCWVLALNDVVFFEAYGGLCVCVSGAFVCFCRVGWRPRVWLVA